MEENGLYETQEPLVDQSSALCDQAAKEGLVLIHPNRLHILTRVGCGAFGTVFKGKFTDGLFVCLFCFLFYSFYSILELMIFHNPNEKLPQNSINHVHD